MELSQVDATKLTINLPSGADQPNVDSGQWHLRHYVPFCASGKILIPLNFHDARISYDHFRRIITGEGAAALGMNVIEWGHGQISQTMLASIV